MGAMMPLMTLVMNLTIVGIVWFAGIRIDLGFTNVGNLMAFIQYAMHIMFSFVAISRIFVVIPRATASAARINEILDTAVEIRDPEKAKKTEGKGGSVEFREVTFSYPGAERPTLSNISFIARPGKVTGIIGSTGSGKSTLAGLILRFYDVDSGSILVDGVDVREMTQESLRSKIGFVPQNAVLFSGSVLENIRFGREDADEKDIMRAAETAQAAGFILDMKEGFSSMIAQGGRNLSGGQKQRISIARAIIRKAGIYILDDCFSALDYRTEARLRSALFKETGDSTVIIISQRVSTVKEADQIIVLEEGKIAGIGTHEELLDDCAIYREIVSSQFSEEGIA
jgi:ATP-binding cassette subfamily B protein